MSTNYICSERSSDVIRVDTVIGMARLMTVSNIIVTERSNYRFGGETPVHVMFDAVVSLFWSYQVLRHPF